MIRNVMVWALACSLVGQLILGPLAYAAETEPVVAVLNFHNTTGNPQLAHLEESIPEALITDLAHRKGIRLVERKRLKDVMDEVALEMTGALDLDQAAKVGELVGATMMVLGSYTLTGDQLELNARLVDVASGEIAYGEQVVGKMKHQNKIIHRLGARLWARLTGNPVPKEGKPWYARWWVWGGLALIGGGAYMAMQGEEAAEPLPGFPDPPE